MAWTVESILYEGERILKRQNIDTYQIDAEIILEEALNITERGKMISHAKDVVDNLAAQRYLNMIQLRTENMPTAYIIERKHFWESCFFVNHDVLIPRPETELLVQKTIEYIGTLRDFKKKVRILEMGVGSGCVIISIVQEVMKKQGIIIGDNFEFDGIDISSKALEIATKNACLIGVQKHINLYVSDWWNNIKTDAKFSIILSNPPYISHEEWNELEDNVRCYEPAIALTDYKDGLTFYRKIAEKTHHFLEPEGLLLLECGYKQSKKVAQILEENGMKVIEVIKDLNDKERVIAATKIV